MEAPHLICRNWRRDEPRHESSFNSRSWKGATMDGTWKGGKKRRELEGIPIAPPNWTWQKELSHETRRRKGEEGGRRVERNLVGEGEGNQARPPAQQPRRQKCNNVPLMESSPLGVSPRFWRLQKQRALSTSSTRSVVFVSPTYLAHLNSRHSNCVPCH